MVPLDPSHSLPFLSPSLHLPVSLLPLLPLKVGPLKPAGVWGALYMYKLSQQGIF